MKTLRNRKEQKKQYYEANKDKIRARAIQRYYEQKEKCDAQSKQYHQEHKEQYSEYWKRYREENKDYYIQYKNKWRKENKDKVKHHNQSRRKHHRIAGKLPIKRVQMVYEDNIKQYGALTCYLCLKSIPFGGDHLEHKIPVSRGGTNEYENLGVACSFCNMSKCDKTYEEYVKDKIR